MSDQKRAKEPIFQPNGLLRLVLWFVMLGIALVLGSILWPFTETAVKAIFQTLGW